MAQFQRSILPAIDEAGSALVPINMLTSVEAVIAPLFVPANRPERFSKAAASMADAIILDLEDAVAAPDKDAARDTLNAEFTDKPIIARVNAVGTPWHEDDLTAVSRLPFAAIMLPKLESVQDIERISNLRPVIGLIETVRGLAAVRELVSSGYVARLAFGSVDYAADLGAAHSRTALLTARSEIVFASRLSNLPAPFDGVTTDLTDLRYAKLDSGRAWELGFGGKLAIHPRQVETIMSAFRPSLTEVQWARRVLATGEGAAKLDGSMVDEPIRIRARAVLARAELNRGSLKLWR